MEKLVLQEGEMKSFPSKIISNILRCISEYIYACFFGGDVFFGGGVFV